MGFFDLNIPYLEPHPHATDKSSLNSRRLKLTLKAMELGYTGVAYNRTLKGVMSESHRCSTTLFPISKLTSTSSSSSSSFVAAVEFHRNLLNVPVSSPFRQYTRLTVVVDNPTQASALNSGNPILRTYDIIAVRPMNQNAFDQACQTSEVDVIAVDFAQKLPFRLKQPMVKSAIKRGVYFEVTYSGLIADANSKREIISNCKLLVDWTRGKNLIFSSAAPSVSELRGPQDVANLVSLLGLPVERAKAAISKTCRSLLANALKKKHFYKEAVKVEEIPSIGQNNPVKPAFDDWLKWDPISGGEGDLLLDDMKKSFSTCNVITKTVKTINFTATMNGLPAHGLQIKDLMPVTKAAPVAPSMAGQTSADMEIEEAATVCETLKEPEGHYYIPQSREKLPENQGSFDASTNEKSEIFIPESQKTSLGVSNVYEASTSQDLNASLDSVAEGLVALVPLPESHQTPFHDASRNQACDSNNSETSYLPANTGAYTNFGQAISTSCENLHHLVDKNVAAEMQLQDTPSQRNKENALPDEQVLVASNKDEGMCTTEGVAVNEAADKIFNGNEKDPSLVLSDGAAQDVYVEGEHQEITNSCATLGGPIKEFLNLEAKFKETISEDAMSECRHTEFITNYQGVVNSPEGRERRKRNQPHQPFLFPFKRFLNPRPLKRKSRK